MKYRFAWSLKLSAVLLTVIVLGFLSKDPASASMTLVGKPGDPDPGFAGFGQGGKLSNAPLDIRAAGLQSDGKLVVAGNLNGTFALARYLRDGSLDTSFGDGGLVTTILSPAQGSADATALSIDFDRIILAGRVELNNQDDFAVARYNPDGSLDHTFSSDGLAHSDFNGGKDIAWAVKAILGKGVLAAGVGQINGSQDCVLERFTEDGSLDPTFHFNGKVVIDFGGSDACYALNLESGDKILVAGSSDQGSGNDFAIARLNWDGSPDTSFDGDGKMVLDLGGDDIARAIAIQANLAIGGNAKIIVAGEQHGQTAALASLHDSDGSLNTAFAGHGVLLIPLGGSLPGAAALAIEPDDRIVLAGRGQDQFALLRFKPDGSPDPSFDGNGQVLTDFGLGNESARALALRPDGELLAAGLDKVADYFPDGSLDSPGRLMTVFSPGFDNGDAFDLAVGPDGKILLAGGQYKGFSAVIALSRYNPDGTPDASFSSDGQATYPSLGASTAQALTLQPDGDIVVAGQTQATPSNIDLLLTRLKEDGTPDPTCGVQGKTTTDFLAGDDYARSLALQADGKIIIAAHVVDPVKGDMVGVARYNPDCSLDGTFGQGGKLVLEFTSRNKDPRLLPLPDGKTLLVNQELDGFALVKLTAGGGLDSTFGTSGQVTITSKLQLTPSAAVRQSSGRVVVAGYTSGADIFLAGILPDGSLDPSFGQTGLQVEDFGGNEQTFDLAQRTDGALAVTGRSYLGGQARMFLAQYDEDGNPDPSFGSGGVVLYPGGNFYLTKLAFAESDRIALSGQYLTGYQRNFFLTQYLAMPETTHPIYRLLLPIAVK